MNTLKIATWNVNSLRVRLPHVLTWLTEHKPDVLALQEIKLCQEDFPYQAFLEAGYHAQVSGQRTYNGVAILSLKPTEEVVMDIPGLADPQRRVLAVTINGIRIVNLYIPNGQSLTSEKYQYKLNWLHHLDLWLNQDLERYPHMVLTGDFNIAPEALDVHDPKMWEGQVLVSEPERQAFKNMLNMGFKDCFREHIPTEQLYTWWDYRLNAFKRNLGMRIDHILASTPLTCLSCKIDPTPRGWERPSDHTPVIAEFALS